MKIKINRVLYWLSIVRPIADIILGAVKGVQEYLKDVKLADENESIGSLVEDTEGKLPGDMTDFEKIDYYFNRKENKNG